jgi:hypothetical protein
MVDESPDDQCRHEKAFVFSVESFDSLVMGLDSCEHHSLSIYKKEMPALLIRWTFTQAQD